MDEKSPYSCRLFDVIFADGERLIILANCLVYLFDSIVVTRYSDLISLIIELCE